MNQTIKLDAKKREGSFCKERIYPLRRGERNNVTLTVAVRRDRRPYDLTGMTVHLVWQVADGKLVGPVPMEVTDQAAGAVRCTLPDACYAAVGTARAYIEIRNGAELVDTTDEMLINVLDCIDADAEQAEEYKPLIAEAREATDAAIKAAAKAVTDTQAAIAEVKATEAKLYPVAENILVGSETGAVAHVEDAFAGAALREITVEGACKQDGIPSPDAPKPIAVVENPTVKIVGRNLLEVRRGMPQSDCAKDFDTGTKRIIAPGTYIEGLTFNNYLSPGNISGLKIADGSISFDTINSAYGVGVGVDLASGATYIDSATNYHSFYDKDGTYLRYVFGRQFQVPDDAAYSVAVFRLEADDNHFSESNIAITHVADNGEYAPYTSQTLTFTLPAEHPYLAKLPDGTADEIVVDKEGNVELVARVAKTILDGSQSFIAQQYGDGKTYYETNAPIGSGKLDVKHWGGMFDRFETANPYSYGSKVCAYSFANTNGTIFRMRPSETFSDVKAFVNWLKENPVTAYYAETEPRTYNLGKIDMPKAQDGIINAWTDAEVTPNTGIEYVRDVNIVISHLESAIASITEG